MGFLDSRRVTGTNNPNKQVSVNRWEGLLDDIEAATLVPLSKYADNTGATNAAAGILAAVAAAVPIAVFATPLKMVAIDRGEFSVETEVDLSGENVRFVGKGGTIFPNKGTAGGNVFKSTSGILEFHDVEFDGGSPQPTTATANTYIVRAGNSASYMDRVEVKGCKFANLTAVGSTDRATNLLVTHLIYLDGVTEAVVERNTADTISGAATFYRNITSLRQHGNTWTGVQWYNTNVDYNVVSGVIEGDFFNCTDTQGVYWGGAINTVNNYGLTQNANIQILNNVFAGYFSYGGVIRSQSDKSVTIKGNMFGLCRQGSLAVINDQITLIRVLTRERLGANPTASNPPKSVKISDNQALLGIGTGVNGTGARVFIYITNDWDTSRNPIESVLIDGKNVCRSPSATEFFTHGVLVHGLTGGVENVGIFDSDSEVYLTTATPVGGGIGLVGSSSQGLVDRVQLGGNRVKNLETAASSTQVCIQIGANVDNVRSVRPNTCIGGFYGVRTLSGTGPTLENLDDQIFESCTTNTLFSQPLSLLGKPTVAQLTNANKTLTSGSQPTQYLNVALTAARTITLPAPGYSGRRFKIVRSANATGAFNLNINTSAAVLVNALTAASTWCEVQDDGTEYRLIANGTL